MTVKVLGVVAEAAGTAVAGAEEPFVVAISAKIKEKKEKGGGGVAVVKE